MARKTSKASPFGVEALLVNGDNSKKINNFHLLPNKGGLDLMKYDAFISYSHAADGRLAPALQKALHRIAKPTFKLRALQIFRDETSLSATPHLWATIEKALKDSKYLIFLASPDAAQSKWVQREVEYWLAHKSLDTIIIGLTEGDIIWDEAQNDFDWVASNALPAILKGKFRMEPLFVDFREARSSTDLSINNALFKNKAAVLASTIHEKPLADLIGEDVSLQRKAVRLRNSAISLLLLLLLGVIGFAWQSSHNAKEAKRQGQIALERGDSLAQQLALSDSLTQAEMLARMQADQSAKMAQDSAAYAREQERLAKKQQQLAEYRRQLAEIAQKDAELQRRIAEIQRDSARLERDIAEANRLATIASNLKASDPNKALRVAEAAYEMHYPVVLPNSALALSSAYFEYFNSKAIPYEMEIVLDSLSIQDAFLLTASGNIVFNGGIRNGTYLYDAQKRKVKTLSKLHFELLPSPDGSFFISNYQKGFNWRETQKEPITIWDAYGNILGKLEPPNDTVQYLMILSPDHNILVQTQGQKLLLFDRWGKVLKELNGPSAPLRLARIIGEENWPTNDRQFFFSTGGQSFQIWSHKGELVNEIRGPSGISIEAKSPDNKHILLNIGSAHMAALDLQTGETKNLQYSSSDPKVYFHLEFSTKGSYIIGQKAPLGHTADGKPQTWSQVILWNLRGEQIAVFDFDHAVIQQAVTSTDDEYILIQTSTGFIAYDSIGEYRPWDNDYIRIWEINGRKYPVKEMKSRTVDYATPKPLFLPGKKLVVLSEEKSLAIFDFANDQFEQYLPHSQPIEKVSVDLKRRMIISEDEKDLKFWDFSGALLLNIPGVSGTRNKYKILENHILSYPSFGSSLRVWKMDRQAIREFEHNAPLERVLISADEKLVLTVGRGSIKLWDINGKLKKEATYPKKAQDHPEPYNFGACFLPDNQKFLTWCNEKLSLWTTDGVLLRERSLEFGDENYHIQQAFPSADGNWFLAYDLDGNVMLWNTRLLNVAIYYKQPGFSTFSSQSPSKSNILINASQNGEEKLVLWKNFPSPTDTVHFNCSVGYSDKITFSKDEQALSGPASSGLAKIWDIYGNVVDEFPGHDGLVKGAIFSQDESYLLTYTQNKAYVWDLCGVGRAEMDLTPFEGIRDAYFSPDGQYVIVATQSPAIPLVVLDKTGRLISTSNQHKDLIAKLVFSPDGRYFLTCTGGRGIEPWTPYPDELDYSAKLWTITGHLVADFDNRFGQVIDIGFLEKENHFYIAADNGTVKILPTPEKIYQWLQNESPISPLGEDDKKRFGIK